MILGIYIVSSILLVVRSLAGEVLPLVPFCIYIGITLSPSVFRVSAQINS